jgi:hypothetical protein
LLLPVLVPFLALLHPHQWLSTLTFTLLSLPMSVVLSCDIQTWGAASSCLLSSTLLAPPPIPESPPSACAAPTSHPALRGLLVPSVIGHRSSVSCLYRPPVDDSQQLIRFGDCSLPPVCPAPCVFVYRFLHTLSTESLLLLAAGSCPASSVGLHMSALVLYRTSHRPGIGGCCRPSPDVQPQHHTSCKTIHDSTGLACSGPPETSFLYVSDSESPAFASPTLGL